MLIDWFTVVAQIVNFLILVALLKYFLYGRILSAMEKREQSIAERWNEAERLKQDAAGNAGAAREQLASLQAQRDQLLADARREVDDQRRQWLRQGRAEADRQHAQWAEAIRQQQDAFVRELRTRAAREVCGVAAQVLSELAGAELEAAVINTFLRKLENMDGAESDKISVSIRNSTRPVLIHSAFEIPEPLRDQLVAGVRQRFETDAEVVFENATDLTCGIAMYTDGQQVAWDVAHYLEAMESQIVAVLAEESSQHVDANHER